MTNHAGLDMAQGFWSLLIPHGLKGGALSHKSEDSEDDSMGVDEEGWREEYLDWWLEFLGSRSAKGVSKDVWQMVRSSFVLALTLWRCTNPGGTPSFSNFEVSGICAHH